MSQLSEQDVKLVLQPYHASIRAVVHKGFEEWLDVLRCRSDKGFEPVLYPRTIANYVFDAISRRAIEAFAEEEGVHTIKESQTVKFYFGGSVLVRFKKANEKGIGQNVPTQAALRFTDPQQTLPGLPAETAKVEVVWAADDLMIGIERVTVLARDDEKVLWSYDILDEIPETDTTPLPIVKSPDDNFPLVTIRPRKDTESQSE